MKKRMCILNNVSGICYDKKYVHCTDNISQRRLLTKVSTNLGKHFADLCMETWKHEIERMFKMVH